MPLEAGTSVGPYRVVAKVGEGGMGEVYRARDTRLDRDVAIKRSATEFSERFTREARSIAALNHSNICHLYDVGPDYLVLEYVEGAHPAGPMVFDEALPIIRQLIDGLEAAHEKGIIHRDLKTANIKITTEGVVKILDFGLAKAAEQESAIDPANSPTFTMGVTQAGVILGTAAYMAPEQAKGKPADRRSDIWSFGVVVYELLVGRTPFEGESPVEILGAVISKEPDWTPVPPRARRLLQRCLQKDRRTRLAAISDARFELEDGAVDSSESRTPMTATVSTRRLRLTVTVLAAFALGELAVIVWGGREATVAVNAPATRFQIERAADVYNRTATSFAVSPDGLLLAHHDAGRDGLQTLFVRTLATGEVREVPGSSTASPQRDSLFWSPDSRQLVRGTSAGGQIFDLSTGTMRSLCECRYVGGTWNRDGTILIGAFGDSRTGILRVSQGGRVLEPVTTVDESRREQDTWPLFLPDGQRFLLTRSSVGGGIATYVSSLNGDAPKRVADGSHRIFVPASGGRSAYLLGIDARGVVAQPIEPRTMSVSGPAVTLVAGAVAVSASENGVLVSSAAGSRPRTVPTWFDRKGTVLGHIGDAALIDAIALSPDGRKLALAENSGAAANPTADIWLQDLVSGGRTRVTFNRGSTAIWSPDGKRLAFTSNRDQVNLPYQRTADGTGTESPLFPYQRHAWINDWSRDGRWVIFSSPPANTTLGNDLFYVRMDGAADPTPVPYLGTPALEQQAQFSPDGRFVAYGSDLSGAWEIYVQPFPNASGGKWMVSNGGGVEPRWSRDGKELFYFSGQTLMAVPVSVEPTFSSGPPAALFEAPVQPGYTADSHRWQLAPDGTRFLLLAYDGKQQVAPLDVVVNWPSLLKSQ